MFWKHNCSKCTYIMSLKLEHKYGTKWDLYTHEYAPGDIDYIARHGNNPEEYFECSDSETFMKLFKQT